jgi:hypothetical protein
LYTHGKERKTSVETGPYTANKRVAIGFAIDENRSYVMPNNPDAVIAHPKAMYSLRKGIVWHSGGVSDPWRFK